jgi:DNA-directed RNA polymerase specialized sigma24 family protein
MAKSSEKVVAPMTEERLANRRRLAELTRRSDQLYEALKALSPEREDIVINEMNLGVQARELADIMGVSVGRVYKIRDIGLARR